MKSFYDFTWETHGALSCFITNSKSFPSNEIRGIGYLSKYDFLDHDLICSSEIIYRNNPELKKFKNKKILVLGAGPTTNWYDWNADEYDYIFSCNHFFLNEKISKCKVDLVLLCDEVDLQGEKFLKYITKNNTLVGFEDYNKSAFDVEMLNNKIPNNVFDCILRFQGKIGVAPKLINLAILLEAREIHFAGVDGHRKDYRQGDTEEHSFQKDKKITTGYDYNLIEAHYQCLKKYIQTEIGKNVTIKNLGEGHNQNIYSKIKDFK